MQHEYQFSGENIESSNEYHQCSILWRRLPRVFKRRWRSEAEKLSISGHKLFVRTNVHNLIVGNEIKISPWH